MTKGEQARPWAWRLRVIKEAGSGTRNIARTCRSFRISRQAFYRWKRRYEAHGDAGLWDRPKRPHRSPNACRARSSARSSTCGRTTTSGLAEAPTT